jgi:hypothetical protein
LAECRHCGFTRPHLRQESLKKTAKTIKYDEPGGGTMVA